MKKEDKSSLSLRLDGQVSIVETDENGQELTTPIDGEIVLKCLLRCLKQGMEKMEGEINDADSTP